MRRISPRSLLLSIGISLFLFVIIFIVNHRSIDIEELPIKCNCPTVPAQTLPTINNTISIINATKIEAVTIQKVNIPTIAPSTTLPPLPPCKPVEKNSSVQRAIIIYYPHHQSEYFFPEIRWLYRSWAEMLRSQPPTWRTDFLIFTYNFSAEFRSLGCINRIRENKQEPSVCRVFLYVPIIFRTPNITKNNFENAFSDAKKIAKLYNDSVEQMVTIPKINDSETFDLKRSESLYNNLRTYGYIDSINTIYEGFSTFKMYDFVLRTDIDVFIYRHFATYIPQNCTLITGGGGYGTNFNRRKLKRIAHDMGFSHVEMSGMGSTWYGSARDGFLVANQTLHGMLWLAEYEFAQPERESKLGTLMWPEWHYGVLLLYGQHLAINHLVGQNQIRVIIGHNLLDQSSTDPSPQYVQQGIRLNLHCWHTDNRFSKFAFKMGHYNKTELVKYQNDTTAQAYAMRMALESKYMTLEQLADLVRNISITK
ncbi:unnamed protein product [Adineta steineri]|uniref:DUF7164 domain-containing protein n=1 Tax=Adineta steineri TaxID=433720 RepID=A0A819EP26_9BILA|nr:unnamed protein product [Adineta steineri]CAF3854601.1 unnamed protein product [Adineta steineri]